MVTLFRVVGGNISLLLIPAPVIAEVFCPKLAALLYLRETVKAGVEIQIWEPSSRSTNLMFASIAWLPEPARCLICRPSL